MIGLNGLQFLCLDITIQVTWFVVSFDEGEVGSVGYRVDPLDDFVSLSFDVVDRVACDSMEFRVVTENLIQFPVVFFSGDKYENRCFLSPSDGGSFFFSEVFRSSTETGIH